MAGRLTVSATEDFEILLIYPYGEHVFSLRFFFQKNIGLPRRLFLAAIIVKSQFPKRLPEFLAPRFGTQIFPEQAPPVFPDLINRPGLTSDDPMIRHYFG